MIENIHLRERNHDFLGGSHTANERRTWAVIGLCAAMMALEIVGGLAFGSIALVADGLHMSTHAGALLLAALAYFYARRHVGDERFAFSTGKFGDLAGYTSAIILSMIALLILIDALARLVQPVPIHFGEAIGIASLGLAVNVASLWLLGGHHAGGDGHHHHAGQAHHDHDHDHDHETDNNMRAAVVHVLADATVSVLVIAGLIVARFAGWLWIDPVVGIIGALVIASWSLTLIRDTGGTLLDMTPDRDLAARMRGIVAGEGDKVIDLHLWRLGPGHLGAIVSVAVEGARDAAFYREKLGELPQLSHITVEIIRP